MQLPWLQLVTVNRLFKEKSTVTEVDDKIPKTNKKGEFRSIVVFNKKMRNQSVKERIKIKVCSNLFV